MVENRLKSDLRDGGPMIGMGVSLGSMRAVEVVANSKFDFVMVDTLHGHFDKLGATTAIRMLLKSGHVPICRVSDCTFGQINAALDAGALGVVVPMVNTRAEVEQAVCAAFYPPLGERSKGSIARTVHGDDYAEEANGNLMLTIMVETSQAIKNIESILDVPRVDCCLIGASDLSFATGFATSSDDFRAHVKAVLGAAGPRNIPVGISVKSPSEISMWLQEGIRLFLASHDLALLEGAVADYDRSFASFRCGSDH